MGATQERLLRAWLDRQISNDQRVWFSDRLEALRQNPSTRDIDVLLGLVPRRLGKADLTLTAEDLAAAAQVRPGWDPRGWSIDQAARISVLLVAGHAHTQFASLFERLCRSAEVSEAIALYRGLPIYPEQHVLERQAAEGLRTNMPPVFEAIAHRSPFPREQFDEHRWNQMVLKALFIGSSLAPIQGLDERANPALAAILIDYARERRAAGRPISPELWRCVGPFASGTALEDLQHALGSVHPNIRAAAALALAASPDPDAQALLRAAGDLGQRIQQGQLTWNDVMVHNEVTP